MKKRSGSVSRWGFRSAVAFGLAIGVFGCADHTVSLHQLAAQDAVYIAVDPQGVCERMQARDSAGVPVRYAVRPTIFGKEQLPALVVYSDPQLLPPQTCVQKMPLRQCYELTLADDTVHGICINPGVADRQEFVVSREQMQQALPGMPVRPAAEEEFLLVE